MTLSASAYERSAAALRLLFLGALAAFVLRLLFIPVDFLVMRESFLAAGLEPRHVNFVYGVLSPLPAVGVALGLLRFAAAVEEARVRRWAQVAVGCIALREAASLATAVLYLRSQERYWMPGLGMALIGVLPYIGSIGATLLTVWKGGRLLGFRPPRGVFLSIGAFVAMGLGWMALSWHLSDPVQRAFVSLLIRGQTLATETLLVGGLFLSHAALRSLREGPVEALERRAAEAGLTLWLRGFYVALGMGLLTLGLAIYNSSWVFGSWTAETFSLVLVGGFVPLLLMTMGLLQYTRVPEASGARGPASVALVLFVLVFATSFQLPWMLHPGSALVLRVLGFVALAFFLQSLRRATPSHAGNAMAVGVGLLLASAGVLALGLIEGAGAPLSFVRLLVAVVNLVYGVRFLALVHRVRHGLGPQTPAVATRFSRL